MNYTHGSKDTVLISKDYINISYHNFTITDLFERLSLIFLGLVVIYLIVLVPFYMGDTFNIELSWYIFLLLSIYIIIACFVLFMVIKVQKFFIVTFTKFPKNININNKGVNIDYTKYQTFYSWDSIQLIKRINYKHKKYDDMFKTEIHLNNKDKIILNDDKKINYYERVQYWSKNI